MSHNNQNTKLLDWFARQKLNREIREQTNVKSQIDLTDIHTTFYTNTKAYTFFSAPHRNFSKLDHMLCNKANSTDTKNSNKVLYLIRSPWLKARIQQHKLQKVNKLMEIGQCSTESPLNHGEIRKEIKNFVECGALPDQQE